MPSYIRAREDFLNSFAENVESLLVLQSAHSPSFQYQLK